MRLKKINRFKYYLPQKVKAFIQSEIKSIIDQEKVDSETSLNISDKNESILNDVETTIVTRKYQKQSDSENDSGTNEINETKKINVVQNIQINSTQILDNTGNDSIQDKKELFLSETKTSDTMSQIPEISKKTIISKKTMANQNMKLTYCANKKKLVYDKRHSCFICHETNLKMARHFELKHHDDLNIAKLLALEKKIDGKKARIYTINSSRRLLSQHGSTFCEKRRVNFMQTPSKTS